MFRDLLFLTLALFFLALVMYLSTLFYFLIDRGLIDGIF